MGNDIERIAADSAGDGPVTSDEGAPPGAAPSCRHDGWTRAKQAVFLRELAATHNVADAARAAGMSRQSAYRLRTRLRGEPFDRAWDAAYCTAQSSLYLAALERALNGVEVPQFYSGELIGTVRRFDERLTLALLAMQPPAPQRKLGEWQRGSDYPHHDFDGLLDRIEQGGEQWEDWETRIGVDAMVEQHKYSLAADRAAAEAGDAGGSGDTDDGTDEALPE